MDALTYSPELMSGALDWINGRPSSLDEKTVKSFIDSLAKGFNHRFAVLHPLDLTPRTIPLGMKVPSLTALCGEEAAELVARVHKENREREVENAQETAAGDMKPEEKRALDSVTIINSISHLATLAGSPVTSSRAQIILYCIYGSYLARNGARLEIEHPQVWKYGPVFPRAYKRGSLGDQGICHEAYAELLETQPDVATLVSAKTTALLYTPMADLNACHKGQMSPYGKTLRKNPDKWGTQIDDGLIADFFGHSAKQQISRVG